MLNSVLIKEVSLLQGCPYRGIHCSLDHTFTFPVYCSPENVPRLFDLVKAKEDKFRTAFYFALRDTLVAKDLDQATRIGLQVSVL